MSLPRLRRLASGNDFEDDRRWLSEALAAYLAGAEAGVDLERTFGIGSVPGVGTWWRAEALRRRDAAIRELSRLHHGKLGLHRRAEEISKELQRYAATGWMADRTRAEPLPAFIGTKRELWFWSLRAGDPLSERQVRRIIAG